MRSRPCIVVGVLLVLLMPFSSAELVSRVDLEDKGAFQDSDIGIKTGTVSPNGEHVLLGGLNGFARLISAQEAGERSEDIELITGRNSTVQDIAWHPRGNTALLVGDDGLAMRYDTYDHGITNVNGSFTVFGIDLTSVVWRPGGDFAYVAAADGTVWKFAEHTGFEELENTGTSEITDLTCHRNYNVCFIASMSDGIAVIDEAHSIAWLGQTAAQTWIGIDCANPLLNECVGFASGLLSKAIRINTLEAKQTTVGQAYQVALPSGEYIDVTTGYGSTTIVHLAPMGLVRNDPMVEEAFTILVPEDAAEWNEIIAGRSIAVVWENGQHEGFFITEFGNIIAFSPAVEEVEMGIMDVLVLGAVAISVPGVIIGLIYMNSPWMQRKYKELRFGKK